MAELSTRTVERALSLLGIICDRSNLNLSEAARAAGLSPSTALRLLRTLEINGFARRDLNGTYGPGSRLIQLAAQSLGNESLITLCRGEMEDLVANTNESVYLSVQSNPDTALYIAIVEGTHSVRHASWVGRALSMENSATGRVLAGLTPPDGYFSLENGVEKDVTAIAAPIYSERCVVASMSIVVPSYRVHDTDVARFGGALVTVTNRLSARLARRVDVPVEEGYL